MGAYRMGKPRLQAVCEALEIGADYCDQDWLRIVSSTTRWLVDTRRSLLWQIMVAMVERGAESVQLTEMFVTIGDQRTYRGAQELRDDMFLRAVSEALGID